MLWGCNGNCRGLWRVQTGVTPSVSFAIRSHKREFCPDGDLGSSNRPFPRRRPRSNGSAREPSGPHVAGCGETPVQPHRLHPPAWCSSRLFLPLNLLPGRPKPPIPYLGRSNTAAGDSPRNASINHPPSHERISLYYCLCAINCRTLPFALFSMEIVTVFPSAESVQRVTLTTFPSCFSISSIVFSPMRFSETMAFVRSPLISVGVPSNLAA